MGKITLFVFTAGSLLAFTGPLRGQEVNSDVKIPPPRELANGAPAINAILLGTELLFRSSDQLFQGSLAQAAVGNLNEGQTRTEFGNFTTSLLVKAGIITFDRPPARPSGRLRRELRGRLPAGLDRSDSDDALGKSDEPLRIAAATLIRGVPEGALRHVPLRRSFSFVPSSIFASATNRHAMRF